MTAPSVFPLSSKFTLEYLLCEDDLDSESVSPCSGLRPSSVGSGHWRPFLSGPRVAVVLFSLAPTARRASSNPCAGRTDPWGARSSGPGPAATSLRPTPPPDSVHSSLCTAPRWHCSLSPDLPLHAHLLASCLVGFPQLWAPAQHTFTKAGHVQKHHVPRRGSCSVTFCRLDSCSPAASSSSELPRASCSVPLAAGLHHQPAAPLASQGADVQLIQQRLPYQPVNCSPDLSKDVRLSALGLGSSSGGPPQPWGACTLLMAAASVSFRILFNSPQPGPTACRPQVSKSLSFPFLVQYTMWLCFLVGRCLIAGFSSSALVTLEGAASVAVWGFPVNCKVFGSILAPRPPPPASLTLTGVTIKSISRHWDMSRGEAQSPLTRSQWLVLNLPFSSWLMLFPFYFSPQRHSPCGSASLYVDSLL